MPGINILSHMLQGDTFPRFTVQDDGKLLFSSGAAAADVILQRTGVNQLQITGNLVAAAQGTAPTITAGTGYSAASLSAASTDTAGQWTYTSTAVGNRVTATIVFGATHAAAPKAVLIWPGNSNASASTAQLFTGGFSATQFTVSSGAAATDTASAQTWNYAVFF